MCACVCACVCVVHAYLFLLMSKSVFKEATNLKFDMLYIPSVHVSRKGSGDTMCIRMLTWVLATRICDRYRNILYMYWPINVLIHFLYFVI